MPSSRAQPRRASCRRTTAPRRAGRYLAALALSLSVAHAGSQPNEAPTVEYQVKASLAFNFLHFVFWPEDVLGDEERAIPVCLIGADAYGSALPSLEGEIAQGRTITFSKISSADDPGWADNCRVVIVAGDDGPEIRRILDAIDGRSVLTIGESSRFLQRGGIIRYVIVNDTVNFEINTVASRRARLTISSKLLRLASRVIEN